MRVRDMDTPQKILFFIQFVPVIILLTLLASCVVDDTFAPAKQGNNIEEYQFESIRLNFRGVWIIKLQGHEYLNVNGHVIHTVSCPGAHDD